MTLPNERTRAVNELGDAVAKLYPYLHKGSSETVRVPRAAARHCLVASALPDEIRHRNDWKKSARVVGKQVRLVTIDFETFYDTGFTLSTLNFVEYIKDDKFETISVSIKDGAGETRTFFGECQVRDALQAIDWENCACIAHNGNEFDFPLLVWKYDCHPKMFIDTLALAKPKHQSEVGVSLKALSERYKLPAKDIAVLLKNKGKRYADMQLDEMAAMGRYSRGDVENCYALFQLLRPDTPKIELMLCDMTARMVCYPQLQVETDMLEDELAATRVRKEDQLRDVAAMLGYMSLDEAKSALMSANKFSHVLRAYGVEPPVKISKITNRPTLALAKTDQEFLALSDHPDERVQTVVAARLGAKSTLLETRLETMITCGRLMDGWMPVPLGYHSATTGRWGGRVWNPQNLPRIPRDKDGIILPKPTNALRRSLKAPPGYKVVVVDQSNIELRVNHYLWNVKSTQDLFNNDPTADLYRTFAADLYGKGVQQVTKDERQLAKVAQLGLGFGSAAATFRNVAKIMGGVRLDEEEAARVVQAWRRKYSDIVDGWRKCQTLVEAMCEGMRYSPDTRQLVYTDAKEQVVLPSGRRLYYPALRQTYDDDGKRQYYYGNGSKTSKIYAGRMTENLVQAIARDVLAEQALDVYAQTGVRPALMVHDELVYVVPEDMAEAHLTLTHKAMRTPPKWLPGIVLWSDGDIADRYGDAK